MPPLPKGSQEREDWLYPERSIKLGDGVSHEVQRDEKNWFRSFIGNFGPQTPPKTTPGQNRPLKWVQVAKNGRNALHGTQLTGLRPKKTFLSRSSKNLQIWHGATHIEKFQPYIGP